VRVLPTRIPFPIPARGARRGDWRCASIPRAGSLLLAFALGGCQAYRAEPLSIPEVSAAIDRRAAEPLPVAAESLPPERTGGRPFDLRDGWNLYELQIVALFQNPDLKAARDEVGVAEGLLLSAGRIPNPVFADSTVLAPLGSGAVGLALNLAQPILTAGKRRIAQEGALAEIARAQAAVEAQEWEVTREVAARYFRLHYLDERIRIEEENIALAERSLSIAQTRLEAGDTTPLDVELAASELAARRSLRRTLLSDRVVGTQELARLLGLPPSAEFRWERSEDVYAAVSSPAPPADLEALALVNRPDLREARRRYEVAEKALELAHAGAYPDPEVGIGVEKTGGETARAGAFFGMPIPIFYRNEGEIAQRRAERDRARHEVEGLLVQAKQEIGSAVSRVSSFDEAARLYGSEVIPRLRAALGRTQAAYQAGQVGAIELLTVQQSLVRARAEALDLYSARREALVALEKAVGAEISQEVP